MEREIDEIMDRFGEPAPAESALGRARRLVHDWTARLRRTAASRLPHPSRRQITLASLVLVVLVAGGLFFGLAYPSLSDSGSGAASADVEDSGEGGGEIGEAAHGEDSSNEGSDDEALGEDGRNSVEDGDHVSDDHEEGDGDRGERRH